MFVVCQWGIPYVVAQKRNHGSCTTLLNPSSAEPMVWPSPLTVWWLISTRPNGLAGVGVHNRGVAVPCLQPLLSMEAVVVDAGSTLLKSGITLPDQAPGLVMPSKMKMEVEEGEQAYDTAMVEEVVRGSAMDLFMKHQCLTRRSTPTSSPSCVPWTSP